MGTYLPKASANGICVSKVAQLLLERGYNVDCLCIRNSQLPDQEYINGVNVYRINGPYTISYPGEFLKVQHRNDKLLRIS